MKTKLFTLIIFLLTFSNLFTEDLTSKKQTKCPIMGATINKNLFIDTNGVRIYACCSGCIEQIKSNPEAAIKKIKDNGEELYNICKKCGQIKSSDKCNTNHEIMCKKCGLQKGSPDCCNIDKTKME